MAGPWVDLICTAPALTATVLCPCVVQCIGRIAVRDPLIITLFTVTHRDVCLICSAVGWGKDMADDVRRASSDDEDEYPLRGHCLTATTLSLKRTLAICMKHIPALCLKHRAAA